MAKLPVLVLAGMGGCTASVATDCGGCLPHAPHGRVWNASASGLFLFWLSGTLEPPAYGLSYVSYSLGNLNALRIVWDQQANEQLSETAGLDSVQVLRDEITAAGQNLGYIYKLHPDKARQPDPSSLITPTEYADIIKAGNREMNVYGLRTYTYPLERDNLEADSRIGITVVGIGLFMCAAFLVYALHGECVCEVKTRYPDQVRYTQPVGRTRKKEYYLDMRAERTGNLLPVRSHPACARARRHRRRPFGPSCAAPAAVCPLRIAAG